MELSDEEARSASLENVWNESVWVALYYVVRSSVPCGDVGKVSDSLPMSWESAAVLEVVEMEENVDVVGSSTQLVLTLSLRGSTANLVRDSSGVVDTSEFSLCKFLSHLHSALAFFMDSLFGYYVNLFNLVLSMRTVSWRWHHEGSVFQCTIQLQSLLVVQSVPGVCSQNHLGQNLTSFEQAVKMWCRWGLPGKAASRIFLRVGIRHIWYNCSVHLRSGCYRVVLQSCWRGPANGM